MNKVNSTSSRASNNNGRNNNKLRCNPSPITRKTTNLSLEQAVLLSAGAERRDMAHQCTEFHFSQCKSSSRCKIESNNLIEDNSYAKNRIGPSDLAYPSVNASTQSPSTAACSKQEKTPTLLEPAAPSPKIMVTSSKTKVERPNDEMKKKQQSLPELSTSPSGKNRGAVSVVSSPYTMKPKHVNDADIRNFILTARHGLSSSSTSTTTPTYSKSSSSSNIYCPRDDDDDDDDDDDEDYDDDVSENVSHVKSIKSFRSDPGDWRSFENSLAKSKKKRQDLRNLLAKLHDAYGEPQSSMDKQHSSVRERIERRQRLASYKKAVDASSIKVKEDVPQQEGTTIKTKERHHKAQPTCRSTTPVVSSRVPFLYLDQSDGDDVIEANSDCEDYNFDDVGSSMHCNFDGSKHLK